MKQLELWEQQEEAQLTLGDTFEINIHWADGDTSPASLERLARVNQGTIGKGKGMPWYRIVATSVASDKVVAFCQVIESPYGTALLASIEETEDEE